MLGNDTFCRAVDTLAQLAPHLSRLDLSHATLARDAGPSARPLRGAVLFTDFAGFTSLTERLAAAGPIGAERLSEILNWSFGILTDAIAQHGGDVILFAGDALLALFESDGDEGAATRAAAHCALAMQRELSVGAAPHGASLGLRTTVGAGPMHVHRVGGIDGRWMSLLGGPAVDDTFAADREARPGTVVASAAAWTHLAAVADGALHDGGRVALVHGLVASVFPAAAKIPIAEGFGKSVARLMLPMVRDRLLNGVAHTAFMAEFRDASVAFVRLMSVDPGRPDDLDRLHAAAIAAQEEADRFDGTLYQLVRDEKGCTAVLAFGLPGQAHDDDAARVANAATSLCARLRELGIDASAGAATGPVFCGIYGGATRRNYGIMGPTMNRAARLAHSSD